jgi:hypothetical protein
MIDELQNEYGCTAMLCVGDSEDPGPLSTVTLKGMFVASEEQWEKAIEAHAEPTKRS